MTPTPASAPAWADLRPLWPNRESSRFVDCDGLRWHVQRAGRGPDLLLLHGTGSATHSWAGLLPRLATRFRVIAPDLPGHGFTPAPRDPVEMADAMAALLALGPEERAAMGRRGRALAEEVFDQRRVTRQIEHVYEQLLATQRGETPTVPEPRPA